MQESDTSLAILDEGQAKATREDILAVSEERLGAWRVDQSPAQQHHGLGPPQGHGAPGCESCQLAGDS
jgi:hypothetical protein